MSDYNLPEGGIKKQAPQGGPPKEEIIEGPVSRTGPPASHQGEAPTGYKRDPSSLSDASRSGMLHLMDAIGKAPIETEELNDLKPKEEVEEEKEEEEEEYKLEDIKDTIYYRDTPTDNPLVRKRIEARLEPLDISHVILTGTVQQTVPIIPNKLEVVFRSCRPSDTMWIRQLVFKQPTSVQMQWDITARLALQVIDVPGISLMECLGNDPRRTINEKAFEAKMATISDLNEGLIDILLVHQTWFNDRVGRLFAHDYEQIKNG